MNHFPAIGANEVIKALKQSGFYEHHQKGSHKIFKRDSDNRRVVVPFHGKKTIPRKTLKSILQDADISLDKLKELL
ncbi:MAG: type II toxin-antitoxin system HicA family toxin [Candidatus Margulisiibacteriota bacterium]